MTGAEFVLSQADSPELVATARSLFREYAEGSRSRLIHRQASATTWFKSMWTLAPADSTTPAG